MRRGSRTQLGRIAVVTLLAALLVGAGGSFWASDAAAHPMAARWPRGSGPIYLYFNVDHTQFKDASRTGAQQWTYQNTPFIFRETGWTGSNFDFVDWVNPDNNYVGWTLINPGNYNQTRENSNNQACSSVAITYVEVLLNANTIPTDWSTQVWTTMHEAGHGLGLGHSNANSCGGPLNGPMMTNTTSVMFSSYGGQQPAAIYQHDVDDLRAMYP